MSWFWNMILQTFRVNQLTLIFLVIHSEVGNLIVDEQIAVNYYNFVILKD